ERRPTAPRGRTVRGGPCGSRSTTRDARQHLRQHLLRVDGGNRRRAGAAPELDPRGPQARPPPRDPQPGPPHHAGRPDDRHGAAEAPVVVASSADDAPTKPARRSRRATRSTTAPADAPAYAPSTTPDAAPAAPEAPAPEAGAAEAPARAPRTRRATGGKKAKA